MFSLPGAAFALLSVVGVSETKLFFISLFISRRKQRMPKDRSTRQTRPSSA